MLKANKKYRFQRYFILDNTSKIWYIKFTPNIIKIHILEAEMYSFQRDFFFDYDTIIKATPFFQKYDAIFGAIDLSEFKDRGKKKGRKSYSRHALLRAFIIKHLERIETIPDLIYYLKSNPVLLTMCGFINNIIPDKAQFYRFLKKVSNSDIKNIHIKTNKKLVVENAITLDTFIMDSKPIFANTKENNPKNSAPNRNKNKKIKRNPKATFGYFSTEILSDNKKIPKCFWGYRTHVVTSKEGIPLIECTLPNNMTDDKVAIRLIHSLKKDYSFKKNSAFIADARYDVRKIYNLIVNKYKSKAYIALNPRNQGEPKIFGPNGCPLCDAKLEMKSYGVWTEDNRKRAKFRCPIKVNKKLRKKFNNTCPVNHSFFCDGKKYGCTKYIDITNDARSQIQRDTDEFKKTYAIRFSIEQYFARFGNRMIEHTKHFSLKSIKNQMAIGHLAMSLVALAAVNLKNSDAIRCYKTFFEVDDSESKLKRA